MDDPKTVPARTHVSTYRLQLNSQLTFEQAREVVDYLDAPGVGCCYSSPISSRACRWLYSKASDRV